jgi:8-oxo-dGTP diphosphatase
MIRRFGEAVRLDQRYELRPGAYAVLIRDGKLLLTHQAEPQSEVQLPGGGIDPGESPVQALHREVFEETGWHIANPRRLGAFRRFTYMPEYDRWAEKVCHIYRARPVLCRGAPTEKHHTAIWSSPEVAAGILANAGDRMFVNRLFRLLDR